MLTYIDCGSGVAGDMLLGALVGLGLPPRELERALRAALREKGWSLKIAQTERRHWPAWALRVRGDRPYGSIDKMRACVRRADLPAVVKRNALDIFDRLDAAERQAHGRSKGEFDPNGLGLLDTLVDVVGTSWGFWKLNLNDITASPLNTGRAAPATAVMLQASRVPVYSSNASEELATPTGVAILLQFAKEFKSMPEMRLEKSGYGAGSKDTPDRPNVVGIYQGSLSPSPSPGGGGEHSKNYPLPPGEGEPPRSGVVGEAVLLLETVIDDMDPRLYPHVMDLLLKAGALDVWWAPIGMKKGRPGISFTVLCHPAEETRLRDLLFRETTTLGIRRQPVQRWVLPRKSGGLRKIARLSKGKTKTQVEFETAKQLSLGRAVPLVKLLK